MKKRISLRIELVLLMFLSLAISFLITLSIKKIDFWPRERTEAARIQTVKSEYVDQIKEELLKCDFTDQISLKKIFHEKIGFLVGYESYLVHEDGTVIIGTNPNITQIEKTNIVDHLERYEESKQDFNVFRLVGCEYIKEDTYLFYSYLRYDQNDTGIVACALLGALFCFLIIIWGRISYISRIRKSVGEIAEGNLSCRVAYKYQNELRGLAEDINHMADSLESEEQKKNEFMTNISHDIRTPLTTLLGYLEILKDKKYNSEDELNQYLEVMERKGNFLSKMLEDFFQFSKLNSEDRKLTLSEIDINELIRQFYEDEEPEFNEKSLNLQMQLFHNPLYVNADVEMMVRVISNLLVNARRYARLKSDVILKTGVAEENRNSYAYFSVENIPLSPMTEKELSRLFERLYKKDSARNEEGSGLGLSIAKSIVELHQGKITAFCRGEYIVFQVMIPQISQPYVLDAYH